MGRRGAVRRELRVRREPRALALHRHYARREAAVDRGVSLPHRPELTGHLPPVVAQDRPSPLTTVVSRSLVPTHTCDRLIQVKLTQHAWRIRIDSHLC